MRLGGPRVLSQPLRITLMASGLEAGRLSAARTASAYRTAAARRRAAAASRNEYITIAKRARAPRSPHQPSFTNLHITDSMAHDRFRRIVFSFDGEVRELLGRRRTVRLAYGENATFT